MKVKHGLILLFTLLALGACDNGTGGTRPTMPANTPLTGVDAKYWFSGGTWHNEKSSTNIPGAFSTLDKTTFTVTGGGVNISFTNVYTTPEGGKDLSGDDWVYLCDDSGKIGIVIFDPDFNSVRLLLGKTEVELGSTTYLNVDTSDMQDIHNGFARDKP